MTLYKQKFEEAITNLAKDYERDLFESKNRSQTKQSSTNKSGKATEFQFGNTTSWGQEDWKRYYEKQYPEYE